MLSQAKHGHTIYKVSCWECSGTACIVMSVVTLLSWEFFLLLDPVGSSQIADGQGKDQEAAVSE